jgi:hypothetical protein
MRQYSGTRQILAFIQWTTRLTGGASGQNSSRVKLHLLSYLVQWVIECTSKENEIYAAVVGTLPGSLTGGGEYIRLAPALPVMRKLERTVCFRSPLLVMIPQMHHLLLKCETGWVSRYVGHHLYPGRRQESLLFGCSNGPTFLEGSNHGFNSLSRSNDYL